MKAALTGFLKVLVLGVLITGVSAQADPVPDRGPDDGDQVWDLLAARDHMQGRFDQALYDEEGEVVERSQGRYAILRPGYFRWEIEAPDRQKITIAEGTLWHYDLDLATATERRVDASEQFTALDLLAREREELAERFRVEVVGEGAFRLLPLFPQAGFSAVELRWQGEDLTGMTVQRRGGQTLILSLTPEARAGTLTPADFSFEPPAGVDVQRAGGT